jgi:glutamyl-Q tRNA(Asp) synthetase
MDAVPRAETMSAQPVFRFAPSPNGLLHLGHAYSALLNFDLAQQIGGRFLVRIEDIDTVRCRPEFVSAIIHDLSWLGLTWETPVRIQSQHFEAYRDAARTLESAGLLYPCFASRKDIEAAIGNTAPIDPDGTVLYPGLWRAASPEQVAEQKRYGTPFALRLDMKRALASVTEPLTYEAFSPGAVSARRPVLARPELWGDAVLVRKETPSSYHLSVVVDDALQGVTHVVRGKDLEAATDLHRLLQRLLGLPAPVYHHHDLITNDGGRKLAKSWKDTSLAQLRAEGATSADIRRLVGLAV